MQASTFYGPSTYTLEIIDDSMTSPGDPLGRGSYPRGCFVYADPDQLDKVKTGDLVIASLPGGKAFRRLEIDNGRHSLVALNPDYPPLSGGFEIVAKVAGVYFED